MPTASVAAIASLIPWKEVVDLGHKLVDWAKSRISGKKKIEGISIEARIQLLEENEKDQNELIEKITEQQESLILETASLKRYMKLLAIISVINFLGFLAILIFSLIK
jgi:hypothetical protein